MLCPRELRQRPYAVTDLCDVARDDDRHPLRPDEPACHLAHFLRRHGPDARDPARQEIVRQAVQVHEGKLAEHAGRRGVRDHEHAGAVILDRRELGVRRRLTLQPLDLPEDLGERRGRVLGGDFGGEDPQRAAAARVDRRIGRVAVALVLADVGRDARGERAAQQAVHERGREPQVVRRIRHRHGDAHRRLRGARAVDQRKLRRLAGTRRQFRGRLTAAPVLELAAQRLLELGPVIAARDIDVRAARTEVALVEVPQLRDVVSRELAFLRQYPAEGMVSEHQPGERLVRQRLRIRARDREVALEVGEHPRQFRFREARVAQHVGEQPRSRRRRAPRARRCWPSSARRRRRPTARRPSPRTHARCRRPSASSCLPSASPPRRPPARCRGPRRRCRCARPRRG